jgi:nitroreductase
MDLRATLRSNGTVRRFTSEPVDRATVIEILDDARFAPSGGNRQPWRVAIVDDQVLRHQLAEFMSPVWDEYLEHTDSETAPFNVVDYVAPEHVDHGQAERPARSHRIGSRRSRRCRRPPEGGDDGR